MSNRDIIVMGASAGGTEALRKVVRGFPRNLPASVFIVLHMPAWHKSELPFILSRDGPLPAVEADGQPVESGHIYIAPADHHLILEDGHVQLWRGPKENLQRPSVNALFRSAAVTFGERVVGVVLSGMLDDGAAGLWWIKRYGGLAVVQDPNDAMSASMPQAALEHVDVDYVAPACDIGPLLAELTSGQPDPVAGPKGRR